MRTIVVSFLVFLVVVSAAAQGNGTSLEGCEIFDVNNLASLEEVVSLELAAAPIDLAWSSEGNQLIILDSFGVRSYDLREDQILEVFDIEKTQEEKAIVTSPLNDLLAVSNGGIITLFSTSAESEYDSFSTGQVSVKSLALSPDGGLLAAGVSDGTIWLWQIETQLVQTILTPQLIAPIDVDSSAIDLEFSPDGRLLASAPLTLWDIETEIGYRLPLEFAYQAYNVAFSNDSRFLAAVHENSKEHGIWLFDIERREKANGPLTDAHLRSIAFSPTETLLATGTESGFLNVIYLADIQAGHLIWGPSWSDKAHDDTLDSLAFQPSGKLLASASSRDSTVALWGVCK